MSKYSTVVVMFDQITKIDFFGKLDWAYMINAWSKAIKWEHVSPSTVRLYLEGIDGLNCVLITRREIWNKIFIICRDSNGCLIQTGAWEYENERRTGVCYRRVYDSRLAIVLQDRLVDFCFANFMKEKQ